MKIVGHDVPIPGGAKRRLVVWRNPRPGEPSREPVYCAVEYRLPVSRCLEAQIIRAARDAIGRKVGTPEGLRRNEIDESLRIMRGYMHLEDGQFARDEPITPVDTVKRTSLP